MVIVSPIGQCRKFSHSKMADMSNDENSDAESIAYLSDDRQTSDFSGFESDEAMFNESVLGHLTMEQSENDRQSVIDDANAAWRYRIPHP